MSNIMVIGGGGVGTMAAVALERSGQGRCTCVLRSNYQIVKERGYTIDSIDHGKLEGWRPSVIAATVEEGTTDQPFDYVIVTTKNLPDVYDMTELIRPAISPGTTVVLIQNGLNIEVPIIEAFPQSTVLSGVSMISTFESNGTIIHNEHDDYFLGVFYNPKLDKAAQDATCEHFASMYRATGPTVKISKDIVWSRWRKLVWNGTFNTICAISGLDSAKIRLYGGEYTLLRPAMAEMIALSRAAGYILPEDTAQVMIDSTPLELQFRPSMLQDVDKGNPVEVEVILGNPLRIARQLEVQTPVLDMIYKMLKLVQMRLLDGRGLVTVPAEVPTQDTFPFS